MINVSSNEKTINLDYYQEKNNIKDFFFSCKWKKNHAWHECDKSCSSQNQSHEGKWRTIFPHALWIG